MIMTQHSSTNPVSRRHRDERGSIAAIETIGIIPIAAIMAGAIFQLYLMGQAGVEAESAARLTARELSKGTTASVAEGAGLRQANPRFKVKVYVGSAPPPAPDTETSWTGGEFNTTTPADSTPVTASATVPFLGIGIPGLNIQVRRTAAMPNDVEWGGL
ncbi:TadE/TadG family type IV pilus assembly protein [Nocardioides sp.]|uniref:TadE/TadG family type IV pilus assembly protein n=1 Tax=Nocardioides sp. TaxID=35761 RepID=UPI0039E397AA